MHKECQLRFSKSLQAIALASVVMTFSFLSFAHAEVVDRKLGLFSKSGASQMFQMSMSDWNENVMNAERQGLGKMLGDPNEGLGFAFQEPTAYMIVRPNYVMLTRPKFISLTVGFPPNEAFNMTEEMLQEIIDRTAQELSPDFVITTEVEKVEGGTAIMAIIREHDPY